MVREMYPIFPLLLALIIKVDYSPGTIFPGIATNQCLHPIWPIRSGYDFIGCYEHDTQAGMLHVADHHLSPGKKQWT